MVSHVSSVLERRARELRDGALRKYLVTAAILHLVGVVVVWGSGRFVLRTPKPMEYVAVQIVPAARLGVTAPRPAPPRPEPKPAAVVPEPKAERPAPVLPDPKAKKAPKAEPKPEPAAPPEPTPEAQGSPTGAQAGLALGAAIAGLDNPNFTYGYYVDQMLALISRNWVRPPVGSGVETTVHYRIQRDGRVSDVRIVRSSGINSFDLAALRAVQASSPLPPLPRGFKEGSLGVNLIVR